MSLTELLVHSDICGISTTGASFSFMILLTTGLLVGLSHCVGMCGPLVSTFVLHQRKQRSDVATPLLIFQFGRLTTYVLLGLLAGTLGSLVRFTVVSQGWQSVMSIAIGFLMLIAGLNLLGWWPATIQLLPVGFLYRVSKQIRTFMGAQHPAANFALGLSNGLLPCGAVYTVMLLAATSGNPLYGALTMFVFGLGTLPAMLGVGLFAAQVSLQLRSHLYRVAAALIMLVGVQMMLRGLALSNHVSHLSVAGVMLW